MADFLVSLLVGIATCIAFLAAFGMFIAAFMFLWDHRKLSAWRYHWKYNRRHAIDQLLYASGYIGIMTLVVLFLLYEAQVLGRHILHG